MPLPGPQSDNFTMVVDEEWGFDLAVESSFDPNLFAD